MKESLSDKITSLYLNYSFLSHNEMILILSILFYIYFDVISLQI